MHPGQTQQITAHITPPTGLDPTTFPVFSGFIEIANAQESYQVSYLGLAGSLKDVQVVDDTDVFFGVNLPVLTDAAGNFITNATNFTFVGDDAPGILMRLAFGSPKVLFDLVDPNIKITTTLNKREEEAREASVPVAARSVFSFPNAAKSGTFAQVHTLGSLFEADFQPRNSDVDVSAHKPPYFVCCLLIRITRTGRHGIQSANDPVAAIRERHDDSQRIVPHPVACAEGDRGPDQGGGFRELAEPYSGLRGTVVNGRRR